MAHFLFAPNRELENLILDYLGFPSDGSPIKGGRKYSRNAWDWDYHEMLEGGLPATEVLMRMKKKWMKRKQGWIRMDDSPRSNNFQTKSASRRSVPSVSAALEGLTPSQITGLTRTGWRFLWVSEKIHSLKSRSVCFGKMNEDNHFAEGR